MKRLAMVVLLLLLGPALVHGSDRSDGGYSEAEIHRLLAPIALYPDTLLSQVLIASTYPLEVVEAARWSRANPGMDGAQAVEAAGDRGWDPSVTALVAFPDLIERMSSDLDWTTQLGDAFLFQEDDVIKAVQVLRQRADAAGGLEGLDQVDVIREREVIVIRSRAPDVVYVPYFNPTVVYGNWWYPAYPPVYWHPPRGYHSHAGIFWSSGVVVSSGFFFSSVDWGRRNVFVVNIHRPPQPPPARYRAGYLKPGSYHSWRHRPQHRRGVAYRHTQQGWSGSRVTRPQQSTTRRGSQSQRRSWEAQAPRQIRSVPRTSAAPQQRPRRFEQSRTEQHRSQPRPTTRGNWSGQRSGSRNESSAMPSQRRGSSGNALQGGPRVDRSNPLHGSGRQGQARRDSGGQRQHRSGGARSGGESRQRQWSNRSSGGQRGGAAGQARGGGSAESRRGNVRHQRQGRGQGQRGGQRIRSGSR